MGLIKRTQKRLSLTVELVLVMVGLLIGGLVATGYVVDGVVKRLQRDVAVFTSQSLEETEAALRAQGETSAKQVVLDKSLHLNQVLSGVERTVKLEASYLRRLYEEPLAGSSFPMYGNDDFLSVSKRPPDFGPEPGRDRNVSLESIVYKLAPGLSESRAQPSLNRLQSMGFLFRELYRGNPTTEWLYLGTADGIYLGYPADGGFDADYDPRTRPWYQRAVSTKSLSWSDPYMDVSGSRLVTCSVPVYHPRTQELIAVVAVDITVDELGRLANEIEAELSGAAFVIDRSGTVISRGGAGTGLGGEGNLLTDAEPEMKAVARRMVSGENGLALIERDGHQEYIAFAPIPTTGWSLGVTIPLDSVVAVAKAHRQRLRDQFDATEERIQRLRLTLMSTGAFMIFVLVIMFSTGAYVRLTRPIQDVIRSLQIIRRGDLDHRVQVRGAQEFRNLSAAINQMTSHLKKSREAIEEYSHTLERKVEERTRALANSNRELEEALARLQQTQSLLVHSEKMASLGQLVAGIAHEINNPVNFIANSVGPLREALDELEQSDDAKTPEAQELIAHIRKALELIETGASRTKQIVLNLRNFSRLDEAEMKLANLHEGIDSTLSLLNYQLKNRVEVVREYGDIGAVECNPGQLNQVFMNILANAAQAIDGSGTITICTERDGDEVEIRIRDDGSGIEEHHLHRIFEPFYTTKPVGRGTGLGLSISHGIIDRHGGTITVTSEIGEGTEFCIRLPAKAAASLTQEPLSESDDTRV